MVDLATWQWVVSTEGESLLRAAADCNPDNVADIARLRKKFDANQVHVALDLLEARRRATNKFGDRAATLIADREGVEQASSLRVAEYKASRIGSVRVADLCCGIGGDAMAFDDVIACDTSDVRAWMAQQNANCETRVCRAEDFDVSGMTIHLDPSRRGESGRAWNLDDYVPPPAAIRDMIDRCENACVKLGPGVDLNEAADLANDSEIELISENGRLTQALVWTGSLATCHRRATLLTDAEPLSIHANVLGEPPVADVDRFLFEPDPSIERAGLLGSLCTRIDGAVIHPAIGLLTGKDRIADPWITTFEVIEQMPWRIDRIKSWLSDNDGGIIEVKTRGGAVDTDKCQKQLRGKGTTSFVVFGLRFNQNVRAIIARRR